MKKPYLVFSGIAVVGLLFFFLNTLSPQVVIGQEETATLEDYWNQKARWKLIRKLDRASTGWGYGYGAGAHIEVVDGAWYLFSRKINWGDKPTYCPFVNETLGTEVRKSTDKGVTWSQPKDIIIPQQGKSWECAATDGDAFYNPSQNKWHYLFQCLDRNVIWQGCHLEKQGSDPMGLFTETHSNPVISSKGLWGKICNESSDDCYKIPGGANRVYDEGTFDIFHYDGTFNFVSFHGFDGTRGFRGIAKTPDFINWIAGDQNQGVPKDAVLDLYDTTGWRESWNSGGSIGFGAGSILFDNGYYYQISEAADISLACTDGQNWDWGIFRSASLTNTSWQQFPAGNPIIYSSKYPERNGRPIGCNPAYGRLFKDPNTNTIYLHYSRGSVDINYDGIYIYKLIPSSNLLLNGDLWKCNAENWQVFPIGPTNLVVYRYPNFSSDGGCYLATNCGASSCQAGQSVYQDIDVSSIPSRSVSYGGKFATDSGTGTLKLVIFELDANFAIITSHQTTLNPTPEYQSLRKGVVLNNQTKTIRFQLYLESPHTFKADEMLFEAPPSLACPSDVDATTVSSDSVCNIEVQWTNVLGETGYKIYRDGVFRTTLGKDVTSWTDASVACQASNYVYEVRPFDENGDEVTGCLTDTTDCRCPAPTPTPRPTPTPTSPPATPTPTPTSTPTPKPTSTPTPRPTATPTPQPTTPPTPTPTPRPPSPTTRPTATPTPSPTPTLTPKPTPPLTPTPTPAPQMANLSFKIKFQGINEERANQAVRFILKQDGLEKYRFESVWVNSDPSGIYSGAVTDIVPGIYDVFIKGWAHLQKKFGGVSLVVGENSYNWSGTELLAGDFDNDNILNIEDVALILAVYTQLSVPIDETNRPFDINSNYVININDISFVLANYTALEVKGDD